MPNTPNCPEVFARIFGGAATCTIGSGGTLSGVVNISGASYIGLQPPAAFTVAAITFLVSADGVTYQTLYDQALTEVAITLGTAPAYSISMGSIGNLLAPWSYVRIYSGSAATPVAQTAARVFTWALK